MDLGDSEQMAWCEQLEAFWRERGLLSTNGGVSEATLLAFEIKYSIKMPSEFSEYFMRVNGMTSIGGDNVDEYGFSFLALSDVQPITLFSREMKREVDNKVDHNSTFVFVDYLQWCYAYAFETAPERKGIIYQLGAETREVAPSLERFLELYIEDDDHLHNPSA